MSKTVDYYMVPQSPWTYFGHARFVQLAAETGASVRLKPMDLGKIFPLTGGLPVGQRSPQRQAYRLVELRRFAEHLKMPLNLHPKFFPVAGDDAARLLIAVDQHDGVDAALRLCAAVLAAVWAQERNIADPEVLRQLLKEQHLDPERWAQAAAPSVQSAYEANTDEALQVGVFGAPAYVYQQELFWGQDRLDLLRQRLQTA